MTLISRRFARVKKPDKKVEQSHEELRVLLSEMERLMALDQILGARKVVDAIYKQDNVLLTKSQQERIEEIVSQSDHVLTLLHEIQSDDGWTLSRRKHGVTVHYRHEPPSPIHAVKTRFVFEDMTPSDFVKLCAIFNESDLMDQWFPKGILTSCGILAAPSTYHQIMQMKFSLGRFVPIGPRDAILDGRGYHLSDMNAIIVFSKSIDSSPYCDIPPPQAPFVRMETRMAFFIQLVPGNKMVLVQISHDDLKIKLMPAWLLNFISEGAIPFDVLLSLRKALANFEGSDWEKRIQSRRDVYQEIEDRLAEELTLVQKKQTTNEPELPSPPPPPPTVTKAPHVDMRTEGVVVLAIAVAFAAGFVRGKHFLVSLLVVVVAGLLRRFPLGLEEQVIEAPRKEEKEERVITPPPADNQSEIPSPSMTSMSYGSLQKPGRGKSVQRLVKVVSAPIGQVRKWKRQQRKRAKSEPSIAAEPRCEIKERRKGTEETFLVFG
jgi:hypothetical protein